MQKHKPVHPIVRLYALPSYPARQVHVRFTDGAFWSTHVVFGPHPIVVQAFKSIKQTYITV